MVTECVLDSVVPESSCVRLVISLSILPTAVEEQQVTVHDFELFPCCVDGDYMGAVVVGVDFERVLVIFR